MRNNKQIKRNEWKIVQQTEETSEYEVLNENEIIMIHQQGKQTLKHSTQYERIITQIRDVQLQNTYP